MRHDQRQPDEEIPGDVIDGSLVFLQSGNRLHAQKTLLVWLLRE